MTPASRLIIVARNRKNFLKSDFASDPRIAIIEDRRLGSRRRHDAGLQIRDRRQTDRRERRNIDTQVQALGFASVDLQAGR